MEKILVVVLSVMALSVTAVDGYVEYTGVELPGFTSQEEETEEIQWSTIESVKMPENKLREIVHYDHIIRIELYFLNKTSGNWTYWALDVSGQELIKIPGIDAKPDGFGEGHSAMFLRRELSAQFTVFLDDSDGESITSDGEYDIQRNEYTDLAEQKLIRFDTNANISVDELPSTNIPLSFSGFMRSYLDPHAPKLETLEDSVYGTGQTITLGDTGEWVDEATWTDLTYEWVAERGEVIADYETILINVSMDLGDEDFSIPFMERIWISNEVSVPVKQFIHSNTSWDTEDDFGYILLQNTFVLRDGGFTEGNQPIPWDDCTGYHWLDTHPLAKTEEWDKNYMPKSGSGFEDSSFNWKPEDAIDFLKVTEPSEELKEFLSENRDAIVTSATYNASKDDTDPTGKAGQYWWNLTFGEKVEGGGWGSRHEKRYRVLLYNETTFYIDPLEPDPEKRVKHESEVRLDADYGVLGGTSPLTPEDISTETVTMASSEEIFKTDDKVIQNFYTTPAGLPLEELDWGDGDGAGYSLGTSSGEQGGGMDLIATLTGIQTQVWGKYTWSVSEEDLMQGGTMASASLDAETGRIISIMEIKGTALQNAFKFG
ncbi:MAG: hypothetical protein JSV56_08880 [Methanomassiliicoccales archaeon]|nr:MAG: hypothetical protein JSV56_08880 [Methanomassiliicoccales archaeon]